MAVAKHTSRAITLKNATARFEVWDEIFTAHFPKIIQNLVQPAFIHGKKKTNIDVYMQTSHSKCDVIHRTKASMWAAQQKSTTAELELAIIAMIIFVTSYTGGW